MSQGSIFVLVSRKTCTQQPGSLGAHTLLSSAAARYESAAKLMSLVKHSESDAWLSLGLCFYLNVLPLTRQLTNLSGSLWAKALQVSAMPEMQSG